MVELSTVVGGDVIDSYAVQDKVQEADIDPAMIIEEDELFAADIWDPCLVCGNVDDVHEVMYCDGCDKAVHVFCAGLEESPDVWYCESCLSDMENDIAIPGIANALRVQRQGPNRRTARPARRSRRTDRVWNRIWQEVSRRLDMDLDFPFPEDEVIDTRTDEQRTEFYNWQRRLEIAGRQGTANRLRDIAQAQLIPEPASRPEPESQEELRAWNAFDKARELQDAPAAVRRKRRRTASPVQPDEAETEEPRQQKRPRLRRPPNQQSNAPESSAAAAQRAGEGPTFLSSLLHEVETKPVSAASPDVSEFAVNGPSSPGPNSSGISSPARSPMSSGTVTPRALSVTPPPHHIQRPISPPLSSHIVPITSPTFSPFSPADPDEPSVNRRGRIRASAGSPGDDKNGKSNLRASSSSPTRAGELSYSAKQEIQRMVKLALGPRYREKEINKDQYTDINRDVSRKMYELVSDASALADQAQRERWQGVAEAEVKRAISTMHFGADG